MKSALRKLGVLSASQTSMNGQDVEVVLVEYNEILGQFNVRRRKCYFERFKSFTFTTALTSYTIGASGNSPTPNFTLTTGEGDRPVRIDRAQVVLVSSTPDSFINIPVWNWPEYSALPAPGTTGSWPMAIYYSPETPNGVIYPYYASPSETANQLRLWWWNQLETVAMADITASLSLPPGLARALALRLAVACWLLFPKRTDLEELKRQERIAVSDFESPNDPPKPVSSTDGIQAGWGWGWFDPLSRTWR